MGEMHEWSLAEALVTSLSRYAEREGISRIVEVDVAYGELMELDAEIFEQAFAAMVEGTPLEGAKLVLREEEARFVCNSCGHVWDFKEAERQVDSGGPRIVEEGGGLESPLHLMPGLATALIRCPACGSRDFTLERGGDLRVERVVVER